MPWTPPWSRMNPRALPAYVTIAAATTVTAESPGWQRPFHDQTRAEVIRAIYDHLGSIGVDYALPPAQQDPADEITQQIRLPSEVLESEKVGTCLDLAALFCGLCSANHLLPLIVVLEGHALAAVSLAQSSHEWQSADRVLYEPDWSAGELTDAAALRKLVDDGRYLAVECTGFARTTTLGDAMPEGRERTDGLLAFERACEAGREQLELDSRPLRFAIDIATAHGKWRILPGFETGSESTPESMTRARERNHDHYEQAHERFKRERDQSRHERGQLQVGTPPPDLGDDLFRDRRDQATRLEQVLLSSTTRLVTVLGSAGAGKSTLLGRTLRAIASGEEADVPATITLSGRDAGGITVTQMCDSVTRALDASDAADFERRWRSHAADELDRSRALLDVMTTHSLLVIWENAELLLRPDGNLDDDDLAAFLEEFVTRQRATRLVVCSRESLPLGPDPRLVSRVELPAGLPHDDALALLHDLDPDDAAGVQSASHELIDRILEVTGRVPWALIRVVTLRLEDPFTHLDELVSQLESDPHPLLELARETLSRLGADARVVVFALAVYGVPVEAAAIRYLLEQVAPGIRVDPVLKSLVSRRVVRLDQPTSTLQLHRLDQAAAIDLLGERSPTLRRHEYELRAASWYDTRCGSLTVDSTSTEVEQYVRRFHHLVNAEAHDLASHSLRELEAEHLVFGGWARVVLDARTRLIDVPLSPIEGAWQHLTLGLCHRTLGPYQVSRNHFRFAMRMSRDALTGVSDVDEAHRLHRVAEGWLGEVNLALGDFTHARRHLTNARDAGQAAEDLQEELWAEGQLVLLDCYEDDPEAGMARFTRAIARLREPDEGPSMKLVQGIGLLHDAACLASLVLGDLDAAEDYADEALRRFAHTRENYLIGYVRNMLGLVALERGEVGPAVDLFRDAIRCGELDSYRRVQGLAGHNLALALLMAGQVAEAVREVGEALRVWEELGPTEVPEQRITSNVADALAAYAAGDEHGARVILRQGTHLFRGTPDLLHPRVLGSWLDRARPDDDRSADAGVG